MNPPKRITYLDMAKGVGIVLMVAGHLIGSVQTIDYKPYFSPAYQFIASFHMPLFFIISGILLWITREEEKEMAFIFRRKAKTLLLPYTTFSLTYIVINIWTCIFSPDLLQFSDLWKFLIYSVTFRGVSVLWFLPTLFFGELLFLWCRKRMSGGRLTALFTVTAFLVFFFSPLFQWEGWEDGLLLMTAGALLQTAARSLLSCTFLLIGYDLAGLLPVFNRLILINLRKRIRGAVLCGQAHPPQPLGGRVLKGTVDTLVFVHVVVTPLPGIKIA